MSATEEDAELKKVIALRDRVVEEREEEFGHLVEIPESTEAKASLHAQFTALSPEKSKEAHLYRRWKIEQRVEADTEWRGENPAEHLRSGRLDLVAPDWINTREQDAKVLESMAIHEIARKEFANRRIKRAEAASKGEIEVQSESEDEPSHQPGEYGHVPTRPSNLSHLQPSHWGPPPGPRAGVPLAQTGGLPYDDEDVAPAKYTNHLPHKPMVNGAKDNQVSQPDSSTVLQIAAALIRTQLQQQEAERLKAAALASTLKAPDATNVQARMDTVEEDDDDDYDPSFSRNSSVEVLETKTSSVKPTKSPLNPDIHPKNDANESQSSDEGEDDYVPTLSRAPSTAPKFATPTIDEKKVERIEISSNSSSDSSEPSDDHSNDESTSSDSQDSVKDAYYRFYVSRMRHRNESDESNSEFEEFADEDEDEDESEDEGKNENENENDDEDEDESDYEPFITKHSATPSSAITKASATPASTSTSAAKNPSSSSSSSSTSAWKQLSKETRPAPAAPTAPAAPAAPTAPTAPTAPLAPAALMATEGSAIPLEMPVPYQDAYSPIPTDPSSSYPVNSKFHTAENSRYGKSSSSNPYPPRQQRYKKTRHHPYPQGPRQGYQPSQDAYPYPQQPYGAAVPPQNQQKLPYSQQRYYPGNTPAVQNHPGYPPNAPQQPAMMAQQQAGVQQQQVPPYSWQGYPPAGPPPPQLQRYSGPPRRQAPYPPTARKSEEVYGQPEYGDDTEVSGYY